RGIGRGTALLGHGKPARFCAKPTLFGSGPGSHLPLPSTVVERARSRLGEHSYRILTNNCEHLCAWALRDDCRSCQVDRIRSAPRATCTASCTFVARLRPPPIQRPAFI